MADSFLALGRTISYLPFFLLGYYCTTKRIEALQRLKVWHCAVLGAALAAASCILAFCQPVPVGFYLLRTTAAELGLSWYADILMRVLVVFLSCGWMLLLFNILPRGKNYLTYVGVNTMPVYILHLFFRYLVERHGFPAENPLIYYGCIFGAASLCVAVFSSPPVARAYDACMDRLYALCLRIWEPLRRFAGRCGKKS